MALFLGPWAKGWAVYLDAWADISVLSLCLMGHLCVRSPMWGLWDCECVRCFCGLCLLGNIQDGQQHMMGTGEEMGESLCLGPLQE